MVGPIDPRRLRDDTPLDTTPSPTIHAAGARDVDPSTLASAHIDYGRLATVAQAAQAQLDAYRAAFTATYPSQFRMVGGFNDANAGYVRGKFDVNNNPQVKELFAICARAHLGGAMHCLMGCPTASELTSVTRALIDAGKLPSTGGSLESRIKAMQWQWGIGIDCTDYVLGAALRASGKTVSSQPGVDYFQSADSNPHLRKTAVAAARPGDVFVLDSPGDVGHRAVVYSNTICDAAMLSSPAMKAFAAGGSVRKLEVDASWSAGPTGATFGGVRRDTWFFSESTHAWAQINVRVSPAVFEVTPNGPANDVFHGVYRFQ